MRSPTKPARKVRTAAATNEAKSKKSRGNAGYTSIARAVKSIESMLLYEPDSDVRAALELCGLAGGATLELQYSTDHTQKHLPELIANIKAALEIFYDIARSKQDQVEFTSRTLKHYAPKYLSSTSDEGRRQVVLNTIEEMKLWTNCKPGKCAMSAVAQALPIMLRGPGRLKGTGQGKSEKCISVSTVTKNKALGEVLAAFGIYEDGKMAAGGGAKRLQRAKKSKGK